MGISEKALEYHEKLFTFSMLLSWDGCESQLKGHTRGNLNLGNDKEPLLSVITQLLSYVGCPRTLNAFAVLNEVAPDEFENMHAPLRSTESF